MNLNRTFYSVKILQILQYTLIFCMSIELKEFLSCNFLTCLWRSLISSYFVSTITQLFTIFISHSGRWFQLLLPILIPYKFYDTLISYIQVDFKSERKLFWFRYFALLFQCRVHKWHISLLNLKPKDKSGFQLFLTVL